MLVMGMAGAGNGPSVSEDDADSASNNTVKSNSDQSESDKFDSGNRKDGKDLRSKESRLNDASVELYLSIIRSILQENEY